MEWISCKNSKHVQVGEELQFGVEKFFKNVYSKFLFLNLIRIEKSYNGNFMIEGKINSKKKTGPLVLIKDKYSKELVFLNFFKTYINIY